MTGILTEISKINYQDKAGKPAVLSLAILMMGHHIESIVISEPKVQEIESHIGEEFTIGIDKTTMYTKDGAPRQCISFKLGVCIKTKAK